MPVRRSDEEPLQKLMTELRGDLDLKARLVLQCAPVARCYAAYTAHTLSLHQDAKFLKLHPAAKKALILLTAQVCQHSAARTYAVVHLFSLRSPRTGTRSQVTRQTTAIPDALQDDFSRVIGLAPALLEELITILLRQRPPFGAFPASF